MIVDALILLAGLALVTLGAEWLVDGASAIARKAGLSEFLIGMTIVGIGTSCRSWWSAWRALSGGAPT